MLPPPRFSAPATSMAKTPPLDPSHGGALPDVVPPLLLVVPNVPLEYCGTLITWNAFWPCVAVAVASAYAKSNPDVSVRVPPDTDTVLLATANSYVPAVPPV